MIYQQRLCDWLIDWKGPIGLVKAQTSTKLSILGMAKGLLFTSRTYPGWRSWSNFALKNGYKILGSRFVNLIETYTKRLTTVVCAIRGCTKYRIEEVNNYVCFSLVFFGYLLYVSRELSDHIHGGKAEVEKKNFLLRSYNKFVYAYGGCFWNTLNWHTQKWNLMNLCLFSTLTMQYCHLTEGLFFRHAFPKDLDGSKFFELYHFYITHVMMAENTETMLQGTRGCTYMLCVTPLLIKKHVAISGLFLQS